MGSREEQPQMWHTVPLEDLVPEDHPLRRIRPLIDAEHIRSLCAPFYCQDNGRPSIPPEQLFLAMLGGYLLGCRSDRRIIMELTCDMAFRWFVGLDIEVLEKPEAYRQRMSTHEKNKSDDDGDEGNPSVGWHGQKRSNDTHRSTTDPDSRLARKSNDDAAHLACAVNGVMESRNRILVGIGVKTCGGYAEREGADGLSGRAKSRDGLKPRTLGADKGCFVTAFIQNLLDMDIEPHIAAHAKGRGSPLRRVRMRARGLAYQASQRARKKIEE